MSTSETPTSEDIRETGRVEAFSDGVFAIAITLLVLEIRLPGESESGLVQLLLAQWPSYVAYVISFMVIAVMWVNHHYLFKIIKRTDNVLLFLNSLLLMLITFLNFPTALLAEYLTHPESQIVVLVYSGTMVVIAVIFNLLWRYASANNRLLGKEVDPAMVKSITDSYRFGPIFYLVALALTFISVPLALAVHFGLAVFFALTGTRK